MTTKKILVAQDRKRTFDILKRMVDDANLPFAFEWVDNGEDALEKIKQGNEYDAILMNLEMPIMDGITATKEIRALGYKKIILAWSAHFRDWKWPDCKEAGMDEYIEIGFTGKDILDAVILGLVKAKVIGF